MTRDYTHLPTQWDQQENETNNYSEPTSEDQSNETPDHQSRFSDTQGMHRTKDATDTQDQGDQSNREPNPIEALMKIWEFIKKTEHSNAVIAVFSVCTFLATSAYAVFAVLQWVEMGRSNDFNRDALQYVQRAFVYWAGFHYDRQAKRVNGKDEKFWVFTNTWENGGNTTAAEERQYFQINELRDEPTDDEFRGPLKISEITVATIGPKSTADSGKLTYPVSFFLGDETVFRQTTETTRGIYFWGWVTYRDVFPDTKLHLTEVCNRLIDISGEVPPPIKGKFSVPRLDEMKPSFTFRGCRMHNCTDNYCPDYDKITKYIAGQQTKELNDSLGLDKTLK